MRFETTGIEGLWRVLVERHADERGSFGRTFCRDEFGARGLATEFVQTSSSRTLVGGALRGMHLQLPPHAEAKLVRCARGAVHDVVCDLRPGSGSFLRHEAFRLDQDDDCALYIPPGCAHGFQTLSDDVEVTYAMSCAFAADAATGLRHDDPALGIAWPLPVTRISDKDLAWPLFRDASWTKPMREAVDLTRGATTKGDRA